MMMTCHFYVLLVLMVVLGQELSSKYNQSSTTCPGDVIQCECKVINGTLHWGLAMIPGDPQSEDVVISTTLILWSLYYSSVLVCVMIVGNYDL